MTNRSIDGTGFEEAKDHVISSASYWMSDTIDPDKYPHNLKAKKAFKDAVEHVRTYHYKLTDNSVKILAKRFGV